MGETATRALVLTSSPGARAIGPEMVQSALAPLTNRTISRDRWLAEDEAREILFLAHKDEDLLPLRRRIQAALAHVPVDVNIVPGDVAVRRKRLLVADMESTIVDEEFIDELAEAAGIGAEIAAVTARAMRGEIEFVTALRERVARFKGLDAEVLETVFARATLNPGAETLVKTMKKYGATCALVSGGFTVFTERIAKRVGFDVHQANTLEIEDGKLKGTVAEPILGREAKRAALERLAAERRLDISQTLAVGDGANDLAMIRRAGRGGADPAQPHGPPPAPAPHGHRPPTASPSSPPRPEPRSSTAT
jgi:phosphoserine phosphatase